MRVCVCVCVCVCVFQVTEQVRSEHDGTCRLMVLRLLEAAGLVKHLSCVLTCVYYLHVKLSVLCPDVCLDVSPDVCLLSRRQGIYLLSSLSTCLSSGVLRCEGMSFLTWV